MYFSLAESEPDFRPIKEGEPLGDPSGQMRDGEFAYLNRLLPIEKTRFEKINASKR
jgi:hypothetical protein